MDFVHPQYLGPGRVDLDFHGRERRRVDDSERQSMVFLDHQRSGMFFGVGAETQACKRGVATGGQQPARSPSEIKLVYELMFCAEQPAVEGHSHGGEFFRQHSIGWAARTLSGFVRNHAVDGRFRRKRKEAMVFKAMFVGTWSLHDPLKRGSSRYSSFQGF